MSVENAESSPIENQSVETEAVIKQKSGFVIEDLDGVNWYLGKKADFKSQRERVNKNAEKMIDRINTEERSLDYLFGQQAETVGKNFLESRLAHKKNAKKSEILFNGVIKIRERVPGIYIPDPKKVLAWIKEAGKKEFLVTTTKPVISVEAEKVKTFLESEYEKSLIKWEGDEQAAKEEFSENYPFATIREAGNDFSIDIKE